MRSPQAWQYGWSTCAAEDGEAGDAIVPIEPGWKPGQTRKKDLAAPGVGLCKGSI